MASIGILFTKPILALFGLEPDVITEGAAYMRITLKNFQYDLNIIWCIVIIGIPSAIMTMERSLADIVLIWFMAPFDTPALAGHTIINRFEMVLRMPCMGLGHGSGVLVGQNLGAHKPERAEKSGRPAGVLAEVYAVIISCPFGKHE